MNLVRASSQRAIIDLSADELTLLNNALNEVCHGVHLSGAEFQIRLGASRSDAQVLLRDIADALSAIERTNGQHRDRPT
jgi:hypothetical protein